ncbi:MAG: hypothetical protein M3N43_05070 [Actinomycetota bacterium]|nr:hypothetical protein [Actinomycetota bacterium]
MEEHTIGIEGDVDVAKKRLSDAGIEITETDPNFVTAGKGSDSAAIAALVEAETLEDAVEQVRKAVLGTDGDADDFDFRPVSEKRE